MSKKTFEYTPSISNILVAFITLITGLTISVVAAYYSISGLTAIFSAAVIPIIIMGGVLEVGKLVASVWLKQNWRIAPISIKAYLIAAVVMLMVITSMGIFGFLSKSHADQGVISGDALAKVAVFDERIAIQEENIVSRRENIAAARTALQQLDEQVNQTLSRTADATDTAAVNRSVTIRSQQRSERSRLNQEISSLQKEIEEINLEIASIKEERAPLAVELRKVEAEVGPLKYIAALVYGETTPALLEQAVIWVIIMLVVVFDPLALVLLLAAQHSLQIEFQARRKQKVIYTPPSNTINPIQDEPTPSKPKEKGIKFPFFKKKDQPTLPVEEKIVVEETPMLDQKPTDTEVNPVEMWNTMIKAAEEEAKSTPKAQTVDETTTQTNYVQNEEQNESGLWKELSKVISREEYNQKTIQEMTEKVKSGQIPFYQVPAEFQQEIRKGLGQWEPK
jgi:predicted  nucleic acid-binding Zn-ribbon protein